MLLLIPNYFQLTDFFNVKDTKKLYLKDLFDIQIGLLEDKYELQEDGLKKNERFFYLRISSLETADWKSVKSIEDLEKNEERLTQKRERAGRADKKSIKIPLPVNRILTKDDYLITTRGVLRGLSMRNAEKIFTDSVKMVPSHHFMTLRPRGILSDFSIPYLHLILDTLVQSLSTFQEKKKKEEWVLRKLKYEKELSNLKSLMSRDEKEEDRLNILERKLATMEDYAEKSLFPVQNILSIKDIENIEITILWNREDQDNMVNEYQKIQDAVRQAVEKKEAFEEHFAILSGTSKSKMDN